MHVRILFGLILLSLLGCTNSDLNQETKKNTAKLNDSIQSDTNKHRVNADAIWSVSYDSTLADLKPIQLRYPNSDSLSPTYLVAIMNKVWPMVQTSYLRTGHDTIYLAIPNSTYLTQEMGTEGATEFMMAATYTYTELKGIHHVSFNFEEGDHAVPGVYTRSSWNVLQ